MVATSSHPTDSLILTYVVSVQSSSLFLERAPRSAPVSDQTNHWYALALRPRCAGIHGVQLHPLLSSQNQPCLTEHRPATGFVRLTSSQILPLSDAVSEMSGCRWFVNADPRVYYPRRPLPLIVAKSSLGTVVKDFLTLRLPSQPRSAKVFTSPDDEQQTPHITVRSTNEAKAAIFFQSFVLVLTLESSIASALGLVKVYAPCLTSF